MRPEVRQYYDLLFDEVNNQGIVGRATASFHRALESDLGPEDRFDQVLELGSAQAAHLNFVRHDFATYWLTDLEDHQIDLRSIARRLRMPDHRHLEFKTADVQDLPFPDDSFDRVLHTCLLHHVSNPELALTEMRRVSKPGGRLDIYLPNDPGLMYSLIQRGTTGWKQRRLIRKHSLNLDPAYLRALEHPNHFGGLRALLRKVFEADVVRERRFPFPWSSTHFNLYTVATIHKKTD